MEEEEVQTAHGLSNARGPLQEQAERVRMSRVKESNENRKLGQGG